MKSRVLAIAGGCALAALPFAAVLSAPTASASCTATISDANGIRCVDTQPPVSVGVPPIGVGIGPNGPGIYSGPLLPGQSWTWGVPIG